MPWTSLYERHKNRARTGIKYNSDPQLTISSLDAPSGNGHWILSIGLNQALMKELRWMVGDKVDLQIAADHAAARLVRVPEGGWTLSGPKKDHGQMKGANIKIATPGLLKRPAQTEKTTQFTKTDGGFIFNLPQGMV